METIKDLAIASATYTAARAELLAAERALTEARERVAALRRALPAGPDVETDYVFREGPAELSDTAPERVFETRLSELFESEGHDCLIVAHLMFGADDDRGCPMCSMWLDGYNGVVRHLRERAGFVVVAKAEIAKLRAHALARGWHALRLLSSHDSSFNEDFLVEQHGGQLPGVSVFRRQVDGTIRHLYTSQGSLEFGHHRAMDLLTPVWNFLDLLPEGRGDWMPSHLDG